MSRVNFPATVVNARIAESIAVFYESMEDFFKKKGWRWTTHKQISDKWVQEDYTIEVKGKHRDGTYQILVFTLRRTPGLAGQSSNKRLNVGYEHKFSISLPREYPANLSHIKMRTLTPLWHPRISMGRGGDACITVNGEVDRILIDIIYHIMMDPKRIRPPKLYPKEDSGMNALAMRWFEKDADNIYNLMLTKWDSVHEKSTLKESGGIRIVGSDSGAIEPKEKMDKTIRIIPREEEKKDEDKKKDRGVRIV